MLIQIVSFFGACQNFPGLQNHKLHFVDVQVSVLLLVELIGRTSRGGGAEIQSNPKTASSRITTPTKVIELIELSNICEYQTFLSII